MSTTEISLLVGLIMCIGAGVGVWTTLKERITRVETQLESFREHNAEYKTLITSSINELKQMIALLNSKVDQLKEDIHNRN